MRTAYDLSLNQSCRLLGVSKTAYYYRPKHEAKEVEIGDYLLGLANAHPRWGFDKMMASIKLANKPWNHKCVLRIYRELRLNIRIKPRKRLPSGEAKTLIQPIAANVCWSLDFMSDSLYCKRRFRTLNVIDDYNREGLLIEPRYSLPAATVTQLLDRVAALRGYPDMIRIDNGTELTSAVFREWAQKHAILLQYIQPGKPAQNAFIERFNRTYREEVLDMHWFSNLAEVKQITNEWLHMYNHERPHEALGNLPPVMFANKRKQKVKGENSISKRF